MKINPLALLHEAGEQAFVADGVDQTRHALAVLMNPPERGQGEIRPARRAGYVQTMGDVLADFLKFQRAQMIPHRDALAKLAQAVIVQAVAQFRLAHQHNLQKFAVVGFEVREQPHLFEQFIRQVLRLVDDERHVASLLQLIEQKMIDDLDCLKTVLALHLEAELHRDGLDELVGAQDGVQDERGGKFVTKLYGIRERKGFVQLTGEVGAGKTTLCRALLEQLPNEQFSTALILNPVLQPDQMMAAIATEYGLDVRNKDRFQTLQILNHFLLEEMAKGRDVVLIIDEAQNLTNDLLEQVRLISNLETDDRKLLQIVLMGQPELRDRLNEHSPRQISAGANGSGW